MRQVSEILDACLALLVALLGIAFARVPLLVWFDETKDAATSVSTHGGFCVVREVGHKVRPILVSSCRSHDNVVIRSLNHSKGGVDLGDMKFLDRLSERRKVLRVGAGGGKRRWSRKGGGIDGNIEETTKDVDIHDLLHIEIIPWAEIANIPPAVLGISVAVAPVVCRD